MGNQQSNVQKKTSPCTKPSAWDDFAQIPLTLESRQPSQLHCKLAQTKASIPTVTRHVLFNHGSRGTRSAKCVFTEMGFLGTRTYGLLSFVANPKIHTAISRQALGSHNERQSLGKQL